MADRSILPSVAHARELPTMLGARETLRFFLEEEKVVHARIFFFLIAQTLSTV